jgi:hypothetical protein
MGVCMPKGVMSTRKTNLLGIEIRPSSWIGNSLNIIGKLTLKQITLPGTSNSGCYQLSESWMGQEPSGFIVDILDLAEKFVICADTMMKSWTISQSQNLYDQMKGGIRYLNLKAAWYEKNKQWVAYHFLIGNKIEDLLKSVSSYLNDYPNEIVVIEISHFEGNPKDSDINDLKNLVLDVFGSSLQPVDLLFKFTINKMIKSGKRALVSMERGYDNELIWPPMFHNTCAATSDLNKMIEFNTKIVQEFAAGNWPKELFKVSWTLTPDGKTITESILPDKPKNLIKLAETANSALPDFWSSIKQNKTRMGNILIVDHYQNSQIIKIVFKMNRIPFDSIIPAS